MAQLVGLEANEHEKVGMAASAFLQFPPSNAVVASSSLFETHAKIHTLVNTLDHKARALSESTQHQAHPWQISFCLGQESAFCPVNQEHEGQVCCKNSRRHRKMNFRSCSRTSRRRLLIGLAGLKLLYQGILETPGQIVSSGLPQNSKILCNCSGYYNTMSCD